MGIISGYKKVKDRILTDSGYKLLSRWTSSNTVECDDGKTIETKVGSINGIVKTLNDLNANTDSSFVPSATAVKSGLDQLNNNFADLNSSLAGKADKFSGYSLYLFSTTLTFTNGTATYSLPSGYTYDGRAIVMQNSGVNSFCVTTASVNTTTKVIMVYARYLESTAMYSGTIGVNILIPRK